MGLRRKMKANRKMVSGRGYCSCQNKKYVHGKGVMDVIKNLATPVMTFIKDNSDTLKNTAEAIGHVVKIGDSTKTIVQEIMKKRKSNENDHLRKSDEYDHLRNIVNRINGMKIGSGFAYI